VSQVLRASTALLRHIKSQQQEKEETSTKKSLIGDDDGDDDSDAEGSSTTNELVWLIMTTKKHVVDKNRLKPGKISIPHSVNKSSSLNICLITADPQRSVKDIIADPAFPSTLSSRITRVIGLTKLKERYKSFESRRQLLSEHDVFLADDRIIMRLIETLGKIFYQSSKRPIPIRIEKIEKVDGKRVKNKSKAPKEERKASFASPLVIAKEIEKALNSAPVYLAPSTSTAVRVGTSALTPEQLVENVQTVVNGLTEKFITKGWRNVKAIHIKGPTTMALPIWLADELWLEETDVLEKTEEQPKAEDSDKNGKKRRNQGDDDVPRESTKKTKKLKTAADDDDVFRKEKLQKRKAQALEEGKVKGKK
jgi:ribosome biogenesis protein UTP30